MNQFAKMQKFDGARQRQRSLIAKVHVAKKALGLTDDDYQAVLIRVTDHASSAMLNERQLADVVEEFKRKGFKAQAAKPGRGNAADHKVAMKARALWISLHQLGAIHNPSEAALEAFARRQLKCERMQWADQSLGYRLIEALKAIAERHGWDQSMEGIDAATRVMVLKRRLVARLVELLKDACLIPGDWDVQRAAFELTGMTLAYGQRPDLGELDLLAQAFGAKLRSPILPLSADEIDR